jgi:hypothetical protein
VILAATGLKIAAHHFEMEIPAAAAAAAMAACSPTFK